MLSTIVQQWVGESDKKWHAVALLDAALGWAGREDIFLLGIF
jgi:hypothetical protein